MHSSIHSLIRFFSNGILVAVIAHGLTGLSLLWDKVLLNRPETKNLPSYVFWLGAISVFGLILMAFGFHMPPAQIAALGFCAGVLELAANWFYYRALKFGEASETLAVMGGFAPLATVLIGIPLLKDTLGGSSLLGFALMVAGGFVMFLSEKLEWRQVLPSVLWGAVLFGMTNVLQKVVFNGAGFISGFVFFTTGTFVGSLAMLVYPPWRRQIFEHSEEAPPRSRFWYFVNRFISGVASFLIFYAISHASPAVVSSISGVRYGIVFVGAFLLTRMRPEWLRENFGRRVLVGKSVGTGLILAGLAALGIGD
jgi:drug/metabolite transporter (DMT)-like permease